MKKIKSLILAVVLMTCLSGCDKNKSVAEDLLVGTIENTIKSTVKKDYLEINGWVSDAQAFNERSEVQKDIIQCLQVWYGYLEYDELSIATTKSFENVYAKILQEFEYTISELEKVEDDTYKATITYKPFALGDALDETAEACYMEAEEELASGRNTPITLLDQELFRQLLTEANAFAEDIQYSEETSVEVTITVTDKIWSLSQNYYDEFLANIMDLNRDEQE